jgi:hypothetical protein
MAPTHGCTVSVALTIAMTGTIIGAMVCLHAEHAGQRAVFSLADGAVLAGDLPPGKARLVQAWIEIHREELLADWELAVNGEEVERLSH